MAVLAMTGAGIAQPAKPAPLGSFRVDLAKTSVSGLSAGGFMATQFHVANSASVIGVGVVAGGAYLCAAENPLLAAACMQANGFWPQAQALYEQAVPLAGLGRIDPLEGVKSARVYLFSGRNDMIVSTAAVDAVQDFYRAAKVPANQIRYEKGIEAGHGFIASGGPNDCNANRPPYVNACGTYDQAGQILSHVYGGLNPPVSEPRAAVPFDQSPFLGPDGSDRSGLADTGYVHVPPACAGGAVCAVHVVFHGCRQSVASVGDAVTTVAGYNQWAANNNLIVLYPQMAEGRPGNPLGCWDWRGTTGQDYATRSGAQIAAINAMLKTLAGQR
ncbi:poly(3-hydroxybutyrate) depolymerase [Azospirillum agricola]|uniref:extracellular catalytic domain type 2 short-chain-length polyhydroxyalkanoate depolymerase n=1 Tax=Azospirillum agricola TaxID=1720247 RepID=UPI001F29E7C6|nr:PHB depolymerase family esterase [Azospirillum agricola]MBP2229354.1 poly(3-hydroxybutyrate) depolymerase [Azospirillum agricola]